MSLPSLGLRVLVSILALVVLPRTRCDTTFNASLESPAVPRFSRLWTELLARKKWKSDRTPGKGEMYHWIKWPHAGLANVVTGRAEAYKYEGPVQNSGHYMRGIAGPWVDRKKFLDQVTYDKLPEIGDPPRSFRTGGLPIPCDTPFKCKARLRDKQVSACQICPDELYLPPDRYYGANEHVEHDPFEPFTRDMPSAKTIKTESESASESISSSDGGERSSTCGPAIDDDFILPCCKVCPGKSSEKVPLLQGLKIEKARARKSPSGQKPGLPMYGNEFTGFSRYPEHTGASLGKAESNSGSLKMSGGGVLLEKASEMRQSADPWKGVVGNRNYNFDDFSNNYGQAEPADIDGKLRKRTPVGKSCPSNPVCCGGGYACCRWCPTICDDLERSTEVLPKLWWALCHNFDEWGVAQSQGAAANFASAAEPADNSPMGL